MTITELRKELMLSKKNNKEKSKVLSEILSKALLIAKEDKNREVQDNDIVAAAKKEIKMAKQSKDSGAPYSEMTFIVCKSFLPKMMTEDEIRSSVETKIDQLSDKSMKMMGNVMKELSKEYGDMLDKGIASKIVKELLK